jgi:hypothetical protein
VNWLAKGTAKCITHKRLVDRDWIDVNYILIPFRGYSFNPDHCDILDHFRRNVCRGRHEAAIVDLINLRKTVTVPK